MIHRSRKQDSKQWQTTKMEMSHDATSYGGGGLVSAGIHRSAGHNYIRKYETSNTWQ